MAKSIRSNRKKALRTIRRHEVKLSRTVADREQERQERLQKTVEAGKAARELAAITTAAELMAVEPKLIPKAEPSDEGPTVGEAPATGEAPASMDIEEAKPSRQRNKRLTVLTRKRNKLPRNKNHGRFGKSRRRGGGKKHKRKLA